MHRCTPWFSLVMYLHVACVLISFCMGQKFELDHCWCLLSLVIISLVFSVLCCVFFVVASFQYGVGCSLPYVHFLFMNPFFFLSLSLFFLLFFLFVRMCVHACVYACMCASVCHLLFDT